MPCEGSMVFRRVEIPVAGPLDDIPITLGEDGGEWGFVEHSYPTFIAGSFTETPQNKGRYYLMAKYELTALQYQALTSDTCPTPSRKLSLPQTSISWFEAVISPINITSGYAQTRSTSCRKKITSQVFTTAHRSRVGVCRARRSESGYRTVS